MGMEMPFTDKVTKISDEESRTVYDGHGNVVEIEPPENVHPNAYFRLVDIMQHNGVSQTLKVWFRAYHDKPTRDEEKGNYIPQVLPFDLPFRPDDRPDLEAYIYEQAMKTPFFEKASRKD